MACFLVPVAEAVVTTVATQAIKAKEKHHASDCAPEADAISLSTKMGWLNKMLWGGSALLAFEHVWHGEVVPSFPFLTAVSSGETREMLQEMGSAGVLMAVLVTLGWLGLVGVCHAIEKKALRAPKLAGEGA